MCYTNLMALKLLSLRVPRESENTPEQTAQLLASLARATKSPNFLGKLFGTTPIYLSLEVTIINGQINFTIVFPKHLLTFIQSQVLATYPDVVMAEIKDYLLDWPTPGKSSLKFPPPGQRPDRREILGGGRQGAVFLSVIRQTYAPYFPLRDYSDYKEVDPMLPLLGVLSKANPDDHILIQFILAPAPKSVVKNAYHHLRPKPHFDEEGKLIKELPPESKKIVEE